MPIPRIYLLSRKNIEQHADAIKEALPLPVQMAIALSPEDAEQAQKLTEAVAQFQHVTAIIADFPIDLVINEDGSTTILGIVTPKGEEEAPKLILEA